MNKIHFYPQALGRVSIVFVAFAVLFTVFLLLPNKAHATADGANEYVLFRIDTELNVLNAKGVTVEWSCDGNASGSITEDGVASESVLLLDGVVTVASNSKEMTDSTCIFGTADVIQAKVSLGGWVTRRWTSATMASGSGGFTTRASQDYNLVVNGVEDERGTVITLNGTAASASWNYTGTFASQSYSGNKKYIAVNAAGSSTLIGGADGYVNKRASVSFSNFTTSSQSADFDDGQTSSVNGTILPFSTAVTVNGYISRTGQTTAITSATVTAGDSGDTSCTRTDNIYYCAVILAKTGTLASATGTGLASPTATTCTYTDRTTGGGAQSTCTITAVESSGAGSGGGPAATPTPTPEPTPTPTPGTSVSPTPIPTASAMPSVTPTPSASPTPIITYELYRKVSDPKVYVKGSDGTLTWVKTLADFNAAGYKWSAVKLISGSEFAKMRVGGQLRVVKSVKFLRIRESNSTRSKILGQLLPNQQLQFFEIKNGWYKIQKVDGSYGWIFGGYVNEI